MKRIWTHARLAAALLLGLAITPLPGDAQPSWGGGPPGPAREHLELLRMWRLIDHLGLDEAQAAKVFPVFRRQREARESLTAERRQVLASLKQKLDEGASDGELREAIAQARQMETRLREAEAASEKELADLLSVEQQARLLLFDATFRADLREMVRSMRGAGPGREAHPPWEE